MSSLVKGDFPPFTFETKANFFISIFDYTLGICGNILLMIIWWKHRKKDSDRFSILIMTADLLGITNVVTESLAFSLQGYNDNRLGPGVYYCIAVGMGSFATCLTNLLCITLYAFQRYRVIFQKPPLSLPRCYSILSAYFVLCILVGVSPLIFGVSFQYAPAGTYCIVDWKDRSAGNWLPIVFGTLVISCCLSGLVYMYYEIFKYMKEVSGSGRVSRTSIAATQTRGVVSVTINATTSNEVLGGKNAKAVVKENSSREKTLLMRVVIIVAVCFFCYGPYFLGALFEVFTGIRVPHIYDSISADLIVANGLLDFVVFISTNASYRQRLLSMLSRQLKK